jgi:truncated hemoglobin YjbI
METSNIAAATGLGMDWANNLNVSAQSRYAQDVTAWAQSLLDAARSQGYDASLTSMGSEGCGAPVLNISDKVIPLGAMRYGEFQKYGLDPARWIASQVNGTLYELSPEARALSQQEQLAALESAKAFAQNPDGPDQVQALIDQLKAFWAAQSPSSQTECGGQPALPQVQLPVRSGAEPPGDWLNNLNAASQNGYAQHVNEWSQSLLEAARTLGHDASLSSMGAGGVGAPVLTVGDTVIPLGAIRYGEFQKYGLDPVRWIDSQLSGTLYELSPEARALSQQEQIAALESAKADAQNEGGPDQVQALVDRLKAFWAAQAGQAPGRNV